MVFDADAVPVINPSSPPKNKPLMEKRKYVAASPHFDGESFPEISGIGSVVVFLSASDARTARKLLTYEFSHLQIGPLRASPSL